MKNIANPIILNQANGSFAENKNEINIHQVTASHHEIAYNENAQILIDNPNNQNLSSK